jgi:hypothetical protein
MLAGAPVSGSVPTRTGFLERELGLFPPWELEGGAETKSEDRAAPSCPEVLAAPGTLFEFCVFACLVAARTPRSAVDAPAPVMNPFPALRPRMELAALPINARLP